MVERSWTRPSRLRQGAGPRSRRHRTSATRASKHFSNLLEVTAGELRPKPFGSQRVDWRRATAREHTRCADLWRNVGHGLWTSRSRWSAPHWRSHLGQDTVAFWIASLCGHDIGFFELVTRRRGIKIEGFGLVPEQRGLGLGAGLLTAAARQAFQIGAGRVWLHTATDDHPHALPNYLARGFRIYRERDLKHPMSASDVGPPAKRPSSRSVDGGAHAAGHEERGGVTIPDRRER